MTNSTLYTDGSCLGNPGPGGWAAILFDNGKRLELSGGFACTTNNRMEILSVIRGLEAIETPSIVTVYSDSQYVCNSISLHWLDSWVKKNWQRSRSQPVKNVDLWKEMLPLLKRHKVTMKWVKGHAGDPNNERCDALAFGCANAKDLPPDLGFIHSL